MQTDHQSQTEAENDQGHEEAEAVDEEHHHESAQSQSSLLQTTYLNASTGWH